MRCINCGDAPDPLNQGLGISDQGSAGGLGGCGDLHDFGRVWILGAADPEMGRIEALLNTVCETVLYATVGGERCHPGNAYKVGYVGGMYAAIECRWSGMDSETTLAIDHHNPGDPGHGVGPEEFLAGSSVGQVVVALADLGLLGGLGWVVHFGTPSTVTGELSFSGADWRVAVSTGDGKDEDGEYLSIPEDLVLTAAADHCPGAAYRGKCPGVTAEAIGAWRVATRAAFQGRPASEIEADIVTAMDVVRSTVEINIGESPVHDMRGGTIPELPEALMRLGEVAISGPLTDRSGRQKIVLLGAGKGTPAGTAPVEAFLGGWASSEGLIDLYGSPVRGYAGGYLP